MSKPRSNGRREPEPEITAQPRSVSDEIRFAACAEPDLSLDPEDLGAQFLRDAVEEGDFVPARTGDYDASLRDVPGGDAARVSPNFAPTNTIWEQTIDLTLRTGAVRELHWPPPDRDETVEPASDLDDVTHEQPSRATAQPRLSRVLRALSTFLHGLADRIQSRTT